MDNLFEQFATITKSHAYDIVSEQAKELQAEVERLKKLLEIEFKKDWTAHPVDVEIEWQNFKKENKL